MDRRHAWYAAACSLSLAAAAVLLSSPSVAAQAPTSGPAAASTWVPPRTADGRPDPRVTGGGF